MIPVIVPGVPMVPIFIVFVLLMLEPHALLATTLITPDVAPHTKSTVMAVLPCPETIVPNEAGIVQV